MNRTRINHTLELLRTDPEREEAMDLVSKLSCKAERENNRPLMFALNKLWNLMDAVVDDRPQAEDRSAVTFWLPKSEQRREELAKAFEQMAREVRKARPETGLD